MNERLPYEEKLEAQLNDLPVPDQEQAWDKMKLLLDDDDDGPRVPPVFLRSCMGWGLMALTALVLLWLIFRPEKWGQSKNISLQQEKVQTKYPTVPASIQQPRKEDTITKQVKRLPAEKPVSAYMDNSDTTTAISGTTSLNTVTKKTAGTKPVLSNRLAIHSKSKVNERGSGIINRPGKIPGITQRNIREKNVRVKNDRGETGLPDQEQSTKTTENIPINPQTDTLHALPKKTDTVHSIIKRKDSTTAKPVAADTVVMLPRAQQKRKFYFSAGLGVQQQLPLAGQKSSPYNLYGRKNSLADYIPSVYLRLHNGEKWLIHSEFRYGAPQNVKEVAYVQQAFTTFDSSGGNITSYTITNTSRLKRTFYHQVPLSFDYFIRKGWSVGTGIMYSRFFSAISEQEGRKKNNQTQAETVTSKIVQVPAGSDSVSFFTKSQVHVLFSTAYTRNRFSAGIRYAKGLQPFIRYAAQNGQLKEEKNQSLNLFIRFRLWKEKQQ